MTCQLRTCFWFCSVSGLIVSSKNHMKLDPNHICWFEMRFQSHLCGCVSVQMPWLLKLCFEISFESLSRQQCGIQSVCIVTEAFTVTTATHVGDGLDTSPIRSLANNSADGLCWRSDMREAFHFCLQYEKQGPERLWVVWVSGVGNCLLAYVVRSRWSRRLCLPWSFSFDVQMGSSQRMSDALVRLSGVKSQSKHSP